MRSGWISGRSVPPGRAEWNDGYRDDVRDFWQGDLGASPLPTRPVPPHLFDRQGRKPSACVNFITAHDGFTLNDIVTYNEKHNEANGEDNRDGGSENSSWNCGAEGPTDDPEIKRLRERQIRISRDTASIKGDTHVAGRR